MPGIVITCVPDNFNEDDAPHEKGSPNFVSRMIRRVQRNHWRIRTPIELATIILESCTANGAESSASRSGVPIPEYEMDYGTFDFLDWFYLSIRAVVCSPTL